MNLHEFKFVFVKLEHYGGTTAAVVIANLQENIYNINRKSGSTLPATFHLSALSLLLCHSMPV